MTIKYQQRNGKQRIIYCGVKVTANTIALLKKLNYPILSVK